MPSASKLRTVVCELELFSEPYESANWRMYPGGQERISVWTYGDLTCGNGIDLTLSEFFASYGPYLVPRVEAARTEFARRFRNHAFVMQWEPLPPVPSFSDETTLPACSPPDGRERTGAVDQAAPAPDRFTAPAPVRLMYACSRSSLGA